MFANQTVNVSPSGSDVLAKWVIFRSQLSIRPSSRFESRRGLGAPRPVLNSKYKHFSLTFSSPDACGILAPKNFQVGYFRDAPCGPCLTFKFPLFCFNDYHWPTTLAPDSGLRSLDPLQRKPVISAFLPSHSRRESRKR